MHTVVKIKHSEYERYGIKWYYSIIKIVTAAALLLANGVHLSDGLVGCNLRYSRWASGLWENGSLVPGNLMWIKPESDESQLCHLLTQSARLIFFSWRSFLMLLWTLTLPSEATLETAPPAVTTTWQRTVAASSLIHIRSPGLGLSDCLRTHQTRGCLLQPGWNSLKSAETQPWLRSWSTEDSHMYAQIHRQRGI